MSDDDGWTELYTESRLDIPVKSAKKIKVGEELWMRKIIGREVIAEIKVTVTGIDIKERGASMTYKEIK